MTPTPHDQHDRRHMSLHIRRRLSQLKNESGQTMAEYSILVAVIALVVIATLPQLAVPIRGFFTSAAQVLGG